MDLSLALESANNDVTKLNQPGEIHQINQRNQRSHRESRRIVLYIIIVLVLTASRVNQYQISKPELAIFRRTVKWCVTIVIWLDIFVSIRLGHVKIIIKWVILKKCVIVKPKM